MTSNLLSTCCFQLFLWRTSVPIILFFFYFLCLFSLLYVLSALRVKIFITFQFHSISFSLCIFFKPCKCTCSLSSCLLKVFFLWYIFQTKSLVIFFCFTILNGRNYVHILHLFLFFFLLLLLYTQNKCIKKIVQDVFYFFNHGN